MKEPRKIRNTASLRKQEQSTEADVLTPSDVTRSSTKTVGRPRGKRSDPQYMQQTVYLRKATCRDVKIALLKEEETPRDMSELVEELLQAWLQQYSMSR